MVKFCPIMSNDEGDFIPCGKACALWIETVERPDPKEFKKGCCSFKLMAANSSTVSRYIYQNKRVLENLAEDVDVILKS